MWNLVRRIAAVIAMAVVAACGSSTTDHNNADGRARTSDPVASSVPAAAIPGTSTTVLPAGVQQWQPSVGTGARAAIADQTPLRFDGIGPVVTGMTYQQAADAAGLTVTVTDENDTTGDCVLGIFVDGPTGLTFLGSQGRIVRVDVTSGSIATDAGLHIGSTEAAVSAAYPSRVTVSPHPYTGDRGGHYLTIASSSNDALELIFETDGATVTSFRSGMRPQVEFVEDCA